MTPQRERAMRFLTNFDKLSDEKRLEFAELLMQRRDNGMTSRTSAKTVDEMLDQITA